MNVSGVYFELLGSVLNETELSSDAKNALTPEIMPKLYKLSKVHDTAHLVAKALDKNGFLEKGSQAEKKFMQELNLAIFRVEGIEYEARSLSEALEQSETPFILLKGTILRGFYPEKWMRTSCDIDVLVHDEDVDKAINALTDKLGYSVVDRDPHEVTLTSPSGVNVELHFELLESRLPKAMRILKNVWSYTKIKEGKKYQTELTEEMFYFYHVTHMAKHFVVGGCGVRPFMDIWVLKRFANFNLRCADKLLNQADLLTFTKRAEELVDVWFSNGEMTPLMTKLQDFIIKGGAFGTYENGVAVRQVRQGGKFKYYLSRIFVPFDVLAGQYPVLKKCCLLMPVFQVVRWFKMIFSGRMSRTMKEVQASGNLTKEQVRETAELLEQIGL